VLDIQNVSGDFVSGERTPLPLRTRRKLARDCTECGVPSPDAEVCPSCRAKANSRQARWRSKRRDAKRCVDCGVRCSKRRCRKCVRKKRGVTERRRGVDGGNAISPKLVAKVEVDARYPDGRVRMREVGRGTRGAPNRQQLEADDVRNLKFAMRELEKAIPAVEAANGIGDSMPRIQREAARRDALASADLAGRLIDETLDRNKYGQEAQMRLMTRSENKRNRPR